MALKNSSMDTVALSQAVEERFLVLCKTWLRVKGVQIPIPKSLDPDLLRWRAMATRHRRGDYRSTEAEDRSVKSIAQWTLDMNAELRGQEKQELDCLK